jgi:(1->4)-alpha-D-glucan 1-alpha-D-glucosylmutase
VDYDLRRSLLADLKKMDGPGVAARIMARADEGLPKMWLVHQVLQLRRERPQWFRAEAAYTPLTVEGSRSDHAIAYLRGDSVAVVVPRLTAKLGGAWRETTVILPPARWVNRLTGLTTDGGKVSLKNLLNDFPVALLTRKDHIDHAGNIPQPEERNDA